MNGATTANRWHGLSRLWSDPIIALGIFVFAAFWGARFVASGTVPPQFYQGEYAPAVMEACGRGFVDALSHAKIPGLDDFLTLKQTSFSCDQIPEQFERGNLNLIQAGAPYLMGSVAMAWGFPGVSWSALLPLYALLFGLSSAAAYGFFRLGIGKPLAALLAIVFLLSPMQLINLPHLRDYAKAPFIIAIVMLLGWMVKYALGPRKTVLLGALAGVVVGVGIGFRGDLLIFIPAVLVTLAAFTPSGFTNDLRARLGAMVVFVLTCVALAWPTMSVMSRGGNTFHVILLGLFSPFDQALNIQPPAVYEWGNFYNDAYASNILNSYAHRLWNINALIPLATRAYEQAGMAYYLEILRQFPADFVTRFLAAVMKIVQSTGIESVPLWLAKLSPLVVLTSLLFMAAFSLRIAMFALLAVLFLSGYPALQFQGRHFFQLQIVPLFFFGFLGQQMLHQGWRLSRERFILKASDKHFSILLFPTVAIKWVAIVLVLLLASISLLYALRAYQQAGVRALLKNYEQLPFGTREMDVSNNTDGTIRLRPSVKSNVAGSDHFPVITGYWGLELDGSACGRSQINVQIQYRYSDPFYNFSRQVTLDTSTPLRYLFHTYSFIGSTYSEFDGIDVSEEDFPCIKNFGGIEGFEKLPLLMNLTFREGWENGSLYQTIGREISNAKRVGSTIFTVPDNLVVSKRQADELLARVNGTAANMSVIDKKVTIIDGTATFKGDAPTSYAYALQLPAENSKGGRYLVAEGELFDGGLTLGLLKNNQWAGQANITTPGKFKIVMRPEAGEYTAMLAHNVPEQKFNHFRLTKLGWVRGVESVDDATPIVTEHLVVSERRAFQTILTFPEHLAVSEKQALGLLAGVSIPSTNTRVIDKTVTIAAGTVTVKGDAPSSYAYALGLPPEKSRGGRYLVAEGELFDGGLTLGLLKNDQWAGQVNVTTSRKFKIVMKPEAGEYTAMLAHNVPKQKFNHFKLTKLGWTAEIKGF